MRTINQTFESSKRGIKLILMLFFGLFYTVTVSSQIIFDNGFEDGSSEWNRQNGIWKVHYMNPGSGTHFPTISSTSREGNNSVRFTGNPNYQKDANGNIIVDSKGVKLLQKRNELQPRGEKLVYKWNEEYWLGFSIMVKEEVKGYAIVFQHHGSPSEKKRCGAAPNHFTIKTKGDKFNLWTSTKEEEAYKIHPGGAVQSVNERTIVSYKLGEWHDFVMHFKYAYDDTGYIKVWMDNNPKPVIDETGVTGYLIDECGNDKKYAYQKLGIYHGPYLNSGEVLYDAFKIGKGATVTYEDVAPRGATLAVENNVFVDSGIQIFPNPTANEISIQFSKNQNVENISINDILGKEVFTKNIRSSENNILLKLDLSQGMYILKITSEKGTISRKIIIK